MNRIARIFSASTFLFITAAILWLGALAMSRMPALSDDSLAHATIRNKARQRLTNLPTVDRAILLSALGDGEVCEMKLSVQDQANSLGRQIWFLTASVATLGLVASGLAGYLARRKRDR